MAWELKEGDNLIIIPTIQSKSIDLIIIDPPYNIGKAEWDKIPDYVEWLGTRFKECERVLKDNGSFYFFHNDFLKIVDLQKWISKNTEFVFKQLITWLKIDPKFKNSGFAQQRLSNGTMRNYYEGFTEYCLFYTFRDETGLTKIYSEQNLFLPIKQYLRDEKKRSGLSNKEFNYRFSEYTKKEGCLDRSVMEHYWQTLQWCFPTQEIYENILQQTGFFQKPYEDLRKEYEDLRREYEDLRREYEETRYPFNIGHVITDFYGNSNVWRYPPAPQLGHITPKPINLIENIVLHSSNPGDLILDCFAGSGTTGIAAANLGRNVIMIEKDPKYCDIIRRRMSNRQMTLFETGCEK